MYNHNKAQQSKNRVHISWDILYQALWVDYNNTMTFAWIPDVSQLKNVLNKNFWHEYYCQSSQNICDQNFFSVDKGSRRMDHFLDKLQLLATL